MAEVTMSLYDINKAAYKNAPPITDFETSVELIDSFSEKIKSKYYILMCREYNYITFFDFGSSRNYDFVSLGAGVIGCILDSSFEDIYSIEYLQEENVIEIWAKRDGEPVVLYLCDGEPSVVTILGD